MHGGGGTEEERAGPRRALVRWSVPLLGGCLILILAAAGAAVGIGSRPATVATTSRGSARPAVQREAPPTTAPPTTAPAPAAPSTTAAGPRTDLPLPGCPPPPYHAGPAAPPWHPAVLVPDAALPAAPAAPPRRARLDAIRGTGMWIWQFSRTDGGDAAAVVAAARAAGLSQLWVRVADSRDGFYGASVLQSLVPLAHAHGLSVIGWGFPYLFDPAADAAWTTAAFDWRAATGDRLDGFSADIETAAEGVALSPQRVQVYAGLVRSAHPRSLLVATVYPPNDGHWTTYPYPSLAPYVDAFAPMVYWGCNQPAVEAEQAVQRLGPLAPVHLIGQAYSMGDVGGRRPAPGADEIDTFLQVARRGALGASFWVWQDATPEEWSALSAFRW